MPDTTSIRRRLRRYLNGIKDAAGTVARQIRATWWAHRDRLAHDPHYGGALAGVVVAASELLTQDPRVVAIVAAITTAYITISRAARRGNWEEGGEDWPWRPEETYDD